MEIRVHADVSNKKLHVDSRKQVAEIIFNLLKRKNISRIEFANQMGKKPSQITRWLSGKHNFTLDTLFEIETFLNIQLINKDEPKIKPIGKTVLSHSPRADNFCNPCKVKFEVGPSFQKIEKKQTTVYVAFPAHVNFYEEKVF